MGRRDERIWGMIPEEHRRSVCECWPDPVNGTIWITLLPGWSYGRRDVRCMNLARPEDIAAAFEKVWRK